MNNSKTYTLDELCNLKYIELGRGNVISKKDLMKSKGNYPVYSSSSKNDGKFGEYGKFMFDEELISWSVDGGGNFFYRKKHKFSITNVSGFLRILRKDLIDYKFLYYQLKLLHSKLKFDWVQKAHPSIITKKYKKIIIPNLKTQKDISQKISNKYKLINKLADDLRINLVEIEKISEQNIMSRFKKLDNYKSLSDNCSIIGGGTPSKKKKNYYSGSIPWATVRDMKSEFLSKTTFKISSEGLKNSSSNLIKKNNVILSTRVGLGKVCYILQDTAINQDLKGIIPKKPDYLIPMYLFYFFKSISKKIIKAGRGATVHGVKLPFLNSLKLPIPKPDIQKKLVSEINMSERKILEIKDLIKDNLNNINALGIKYINNEFNL